MNKPKQNAKPKESNRMFCIAQVGGTVGEKKELAFTLERGKITLEVFNFGVVKEERILITAVEFTNLPALKRFYTMLGVAIKTFN